MQLLIATTNPGKLKEYRLLLKGSGFELKPIKLTVAETGKTYRANAILKAVAAGRKSGQITIADDTGLEIKALSAGPGIYSNRYARGDFKTAIKKILSRLKHKTDRRARFVCVIALYLPKTGKVKTFTGTVSGLIGKKPEDNGGFGYDPIFIYPGKKAKVSHRARAAKKLKEFLKAERKRPEF